MKILLRIVYNLLLLILSVVTYSAAVAIKGVKKLPDVSNKLTHNKQEIESHPEYLALTASVETLVPFMTLPRSLAMNWVLKTYTWMMVYLICGEAIKRYAPRTYDSYMQFLLSASLLTNGMGTVSRMMAITLLNYSLIKENTSLSTRIKAYVFCCNVLPRLLYTYESANIAEEARRKLGYADNVSFDKVIRERYFVNGTASLDEASVVLIGETHTSPEHQLSENWIMSSSGLGNYGDVVLLETEYHEHYYIKGDYAFLSNFEDTEGALWENPEKCRYPSLLELNGWETLALESAKRDGVDSVRAMLAQPSILSKVSQENRACVAELDKFQHLLASISKDIESHIAAGNVDQSSPDSKGFIYSSMRMIKQLTAEIHAKVEECQQITKMTSSAASKTNELLQDQQTKVYSPEILNARNAGLCQSVLSSLNGLFRAHGRIFVVAGNSHIDPDKSTAQECLANNGVPYVALMPKKP